MNHRSLTIPPADVVRPLWAAYASARTVANRNALVEAYLPLVRLVAIRLYDRLPMHVDVDDLDSYGTFGLIDAVERFDQSRNLVFSTYARRRIYGSIIDQLRLFDMVPRLTRNRTRDLAAAVAVLRSVLGRDPTHQELADEMDLDERGLATVLNDQAVEFESIDESRGRNDPRGRSRLHFLADGRAADPATIAEARDEARALVAPLRRRDRLAVTLYYGDGLKMREIGDILGVCESNISTMIQKVLPDVRARAAELTVAAEAEG